MYNMFGTTIELPTLLCEGYLTQANLGAGTNEIQESKGIYAVNRYGVGRFFLLCFEVCNTSLAPGSKLSS